MRRKQISKKIRLMVINSGNKRCRHCFSKDNLVVDHIIPVCKGGNNSLNNLQRLCQKCNSEKGAHVNVPYRGYGQMWQKKDTRAYSEAGINFPVFFGYKQYKDNLEYLIDRLRSIQNSSIGRE